MDNLEPKSEAASISAAPADPGSLQEQLISLQNTLVSALVLMILVTGVLGYNMRRQSRITRGELDAIRPQAEAINAQYERITGAGINDLAKKLSDFGATHPDFAPILTKYGVMRPAGTGAPAPSLKAPSAAPAPAPAPTKK